MKTTMLMMGGAALALAGCASLVTGGDLIRPGEPMSRFTFLNQAPNGQPFDTVLISTCSAASYGLDRLPPNVTLQVGQSHTWEISAGCYDVMVGMVGQGSTSGQRINIPPRTHFTLYYDGTDNSRTETR